MNKYDKMIELNREKSDEKIVAAKLAIRKKKLQKENQRLRKGMGKQDKKVWKNL